MYDRGNSATSRMAPGEVDWYNLFRKLAVRWFHLGSILTALSSDTAKVAEEAAVQTVEHTSAPEVAAGAVYHLTDKRFTAWGKYSKVLVPRAATSIRLAAEKVNLAGWAVFELEAGMAIYSCADRTW